MPGQSEWAETGQPTPLAPHIYKPLGRPPKQRKRASDEPRNPYKASRPNRPVRCGKCKKEGHNSRGCKAGITGETPWQRRQRLEREKTVSNQDLNGKKKKLVFKLTINTVLKLGFVAGKGRGACTQICTSACTPATIPAAYPDLQHDVCHSAFILTARKSTQVISQESRMVLFLTARVSHTQGDLGYLTKFFTGNLVQ